MALLRFDGSWHDLWDMARAEVRARTADSGPGSAKMKRAIRELARKLDGRINWPPTPAGRIAEQLDRPVLRIALGLLLQAAHDVSRDAGELGAPDA